MLLRGIINWGRPVAEILADGSLCIQQARATEGSGLVSVLLEGPPNSGKTALAAQIAKNSDFPFVKVCTPDDMVGFVESAKCLSIRKVIHNSSFTSLTLQIYFKVNIFFIVFDMEFKIITYYQCIYTFSGIR